MWRTKKPEEENPSSLARDNPSPHGLHDLSSRSEQPTVRPAKIGARLGQTLSLKGELVGNEELTLDGELEGSIDLGEHSLTVGPKGRVQADIRAREIIVEGTVRGNLRASDRLQIAKSGSVVGDLVAARIVIEDGAYFKGSIDVQKPDGRKPRAAPSAGESLGITPAPPTAAKDKLQ